MHILQCANCRNFLGWGNLKEASSQSQRKSQFIIQKTANILLKNVPSTTANNDQLCPIVMCNNCQCAVARIKFDGESVLLKRKSKVLITELTDQTEEQYHEEEDEEQIKIEDVVQENEAEIDSRQTLDKCIDFASQYGAQFEYYLNQVETRCNRLKAHLQHVEEKEKNLVLIWNHVKDVAFTKK